MGLIQMIKGAIEKRNLAVASDYHHMKAPQPVYTNWSLEKAVKEGYRSNSWVYRAVYLKAKAAASVPWYVVDKEGEKIEGHHLTSLFENPNPFISKQDLFELVVSWLDLAGNSYLKKSKIAVQTKELWPISPDRLRPVRSENPEEWMKGYRLDKDKGITYKPEEVIHHMYMNPADPLIGIAPLEVAGKTVDVDNGQRDFNKSTTQNRGIVDGIFIFKRRFGSQQESDTIRDQLNERHRGRRAFGVLGDEAKYQRTALTPAEMDFINSRKVNREEILIAFGIPPIYAGAVEGATMNNYRTSELIFWFGTMLFLMDDLLDTFNFSFKDELGDGLKLVYDISNVPAIREAMLAKTKVAKELYSMGVPFEQLNKVFKLGFSEFEGWDESNPGGGSSDIQTNSEVRTHKPPLELRASAKKLQKLIDAEAVKNADNYDELLETDRDAVFKTLNRTLATPAIEKTVKKNIPLWVDLLSRMYKGTAEKLAKEVEVRADQTFYKALEAILLKEAKILKEASLIADSTINTILLHVRNGVEQGLTVNQIQQSIIDSGQLGPHPSLPFEDITYRALRISRTVTGTAANAGQLAEAYAGGATHKTWTTASFEVRKTHKKMNNKKVGILDDFKVDGKYPALFPLDTELPAKERVNCRCTLTYSMEGAQPVLPEAPVKKPVTQEPETVPEPEVEPGLEDLIVLQKEKAKKAIAEQELTDTQKDILEGFVDDSALTEEDLLKFSEFTNGELSPEDILKLSEAIAERAPIHINVPLEMPDTEILKAFMANGDLKNQFQLREKASSGGALAPRAGQDRDDWEMNITNDKLAHTESYEKAKKKMDYLDEEDANERPIYGYMSDGSNEYRKYIGGSYGQITFVLKPEVTKRASAFTSNTSTFSRSRHKMMQSTSNKQLVETMVGNLSTEELKAVLRGGVPTKFQSGAYTEMQFWGGVNIGKDVAKIMSPVDLPHLRNLARKWNCDFELKDR